MQLMGNSALPLQLSIQETWQKFQDPDAIANPEKADNLAEFMGQRPMPESHVMVQPLVFGATECKRDRPTKRDDQAHNATLRQYARQQGHFGIADSRPLIDTKSSRLVARTQAGEDARAQMLFDKETPPQEIYGW